MKLESLNTQIEALEAFTCFCVYDETGKKKKCCKKYKKKGKFCGSCPNK